MTCTHSSRTASARATRCRAVRRDDSGVVPQVTSGFWPAAARSGVGSSSYNDPLNKVDPLGLQPTDDSPELRGMGNVAPGGAWSWPPGAHQGDCDPGYNDVGDTCEPDFVEKAREIWRGFQRGVLRPESKGACVDGEASIVFALEVQGCWVDDGDAIHNVGFVGYGAGVPGVSLTIGKLMSNAERGDQLRGETMCVGFGGGFFGGAVTAAVCMGSYVDTHESFSYNGIFSIYAGVGVGGGVLPVDVHIIPGYTGVSELFDYPQFWPDGPSIIPDGFPF